MNRRRGGTDTHRIVDDGDARPDVDGAAESELLRFLDAMEPFDEPFPDIDESDLLPLDEGPDLRLP